MCGRTACTLAPNELVQKCSSSLPNTCLRRPLEWVDNKHEGHVYSTSFNKAPGSACPVLVAKDHLPECPPYKNDVFDGENGNNRGV